MIVITAGLLWLSWGVLKVGDGQGKGQFLWDTWKRSNKGFLLLMAAVSIVSHTIRALRWRMLLVPSGNNVKLSSSFLSLMIGYLVNLAIPRGGEVSRCYNLFKLENTPVATSFGTVVVERIVDLICLLLLIAFSFFVEWSKLENFINSLTLSPGTGFRIPTWLIAAAIVSVGCIFLLFLFRRNEKLKKILVGFKEGLASVFRLDKKLLFVFYSFTIWASYFVMSYCVLMAFQETAGLGFRAVITLFAIGSIAMTVPLPGGAGSYHTLVPLGLVMLYHLPKDDAIAFTFIFHAWQTLIMIVAGIVSLIISYWLIRWREVKIK